MNKYLIILGCMLLSCQAPMSKMGKKQNEKIPNSWEMMENISSRSWSKEDVRKILGEPADIFERKKKSNEFWTFNDIKTGHQRFSINFSEDDLVSVVVYIPQEYERSHFTIDVILERWKGYHCVENSDLQLSPDLVKKNRYFDCDEGRKFFFNKWNEVSSLNISVRKIQTKNL